MMDISYMNNDKSAGEPKKVENASIISPRVYECVAKLDQECNSVP